MSLLQNEEFVIYQLRIGFLAHNKDIYPERLINVNSTVLNDPAFRAAGWLPNAAELKRTHSPPIPAVVTSEYFRAPASAGLRAPAEFGEYDDEGGMVTGAGSNDTVGPTRTRRRRRRAERDAEDDDSSDLSDESDEADEAHTAVKNLNFHKMPRRNRAGSSPPVQQTRPRADGPKVMITHPSVRRPNGAPGRDESVSTVDTVETIRGRPRRDTTTSSDLSSENEMDSSLFRKRTVKGQIPDLARMQSLRIQEEQEDDGVDPDMDEDLAGDDSDDSSLPSDFSPTADSASILEDIGDGLTSSLGPPLRRLAAGTPRDHSPRKSRQPPQILQALPPPRPISIIQPISLLTLALRSKNKKPEGPFERFANLSGKGDPSPLYVKLYIPRCADTDMFELLIRKTTNGDQHLTVAEAIGLALYRYGEEGFQPPIEPSKMNVNWFNFRMVEDGEVEMDFPPISRTKAMTDFTSNNNRPQRGRARDKPWDEFALVEATEREFQENERLTPIFSVHAKEAQAAAEIAKSANSAPSKAQLATPAVTPAPRNPVLGPSFLTTARKDGSSLLDAPAGPVTHSVPRTGPPKTITLHFTDDNFLTRTTTIEVTTDTYIAEVFDQVCKKLNVDKALFVLKVSGSSTVVPTDRTIEALGERGDLDLVRRRFVGAEGMAALGLSGSAPASGSPNAPLLVATGATPVKKSKNKHHIVRPSYVPQANPRFDPFSAANSFSKRYVVVRRQPMSFSSSSTRILSLEGEYLHIMPSQEGANPNNPGGAGKGALVEATGKTTTVHYTSVVGCDSSQKRPKGFKILVYKENATKRYDFDASSAQVAKEIVKEIRNGMKRFEGGGY